MSDCNRHAGTVAEEARRECVVCLYHHRNQLKLMATWMGEKHSARMEEARQFERDVMDRSAAIAEAARRDYLPERYIWLGLVVLLAVALFSGCTHVQRRTVETQSVATVTAEVKREAMASVATTTTSEARRTVRTKRTYTPRPDGGFESVEELEELLTSDGRVSGESKEQETAKVDAEAEKKDTENEVVKTGRPWWWVWMQVAMLVGVLAIIGFSLWQLRRLRRL